MQIPASFNQQLLVTEAPAPTEELRLDFQQAASSEETKHQSVPFEGSLLLVWSLFSASLSGPNILTASSLRLFSCLCLAASCSIELCWSCV
jgi:hypothetical protein